MVALQNILLITIDDLRPQLNESNGMSEMVTPNLDPRKQKSRQVCRRSVERLPSCLCADGGVLSCLETPKQNLTLMSFSVRDAEWRYTEWRNWKNGYVFGGFRVVSCRSNPRAKQIRASRNPMADDSVSPSRARRNSSTLRSPSPLPPNPLPPPATDEDSSPAADGEARPSSPGMEGDKRDDYQVIGPALASWRRPASPRCSRRVHSPTACNS